MEQQAFTLVQLTKIITDTIAAQRNLREVWVVAETGDVRVSGGHCYLELLEKTPDGRTVARLRATIWANSYQRLNYEFKSVTGSDIVSGIKVMVRVTVSFSGAWGMNAVISAINPSYTLGDAVRRRNEILQRLKNERLLDLNKSVAWAPHTWRVAVVSAQGAAGYGDFVNQLYNNTSRLRFKTRLFPAVLQGERTSSTVIAALNKIKAELSDWDAVVIIRGGGSTSDLAAFDDYDIAATIARFPLPVIVGIGHERDVTVLDFVANQRVKTPTAAAQLFISHGVEQLKCVSDLASIIYQSVVNQITANREQLTYIGAQIPGITRVNLNREHNRLDSAITAISTTVLNRLTQSANHVNHLADMVGSLSLSRIDPQRERLDNIARSLVQAVEARLDAHRRTLDANEALVKVLSPRSILNRGFTITVDITGRAIKSVDDAAPGQQLVTYVADGRIGSRVTGSAHNKKQA
jgi:exodeoxyribonuclease VII large subunit